MIEIPRYLFVVYNMSVGALIMLVAIWLVFRPRDNKNKED